MTAEEIAHRAEQADHILHNPIFEEIFNELKKSYISRWENSSDDDTKGREVIYNRLKAIQEVRRELIRLLNAKRITDKG